MARIMCGGWNACAKRCRAREKGVLERFRAPAKLCPPARQCSKSVYPISLEKAGRAELPYGADRVLSGHGFTRATLAFGFSTTATQDRRLPHLDGHLVALERIWLMADMGR